MPKPMFFDWVHGFLFPFHKPKYYQCAFSLRNLRLTQGGRGYTIPKWNGKNMKEQTTNTNGQLPNNHMRRNPFDFWNVSLKQRSILETNLAWHYLWCNSFCSKLFQTPQSPGTLRRQCYSCCSLLLRLLLRCMCVHRCQPEWCKQTLKAASYPFPVISASVHGSDGHVHVAYWTWCARATMFSHPLRDFRLGIPAPYLCTPQDST